jgi:two-component system sensor histidine kinase DegS
VLEEAEKEIRRVIYDLHPPVLDVVGLVPALQEYLGRLQSLSDIDCSIVVKGKTYRLPSETEVAVFRMIEEALHNVAVHSEAETATVSIEFKPEIFCVTVQDDGQGFDYPHWTENRAGSHLGLLGMRERVESLGGNLQVDSEMARGTRVIFQLPVHAARDL